MEFLPIEIVEHHLISYLDVVGTYHAMLTCRTWNRTFDRDSCWKTLFSSHYPEEKVWQGETWKLIYRAKKDRTTHPVAVRGGTEGWTWSMDIFLPQSKPSETFMEELTQVGVMNGPIELNGYVIFVFTDASPSIIGFSIDRTGLAPTIVEDKVLHQAKVQPVLFEPHVRRDIQTADLVDVQRQEDSWKSLFERLCGAMFANCGRNERDGFYRPDYWQTENFRWLLNSIKKLPQG